MADDPVVEVVPGNRAKAWSQMIQRGRSDDPVVVVIPGDLHLTDPGLENHRMSHQVVDEINRVVRPDFVQFIGDNVQDATEAQFRLFDELRGRLSVPHLALVGDHDVQGDPEARGFRAHVGETFGSTTLRGFRFIRLDTQQARPLGMGREQVEWFRSEVDAAVAAGEQVVIFQHNYPYQIWETFDGPGIDEWREVVQTRRIAAIVAGHTHYCQIANDGRNIAVATRSIGDPEGGPPGYLFAYFHGDDLAVAYRSVEDRGPIAMIAHPREAILATGPAHVVRGPDQIRVCTWPESTATTVRSRVDDQAWITLEVDDLVGSRWSAPLHLDPLRKGEHTLEVEVCDEEDCVGLRSIRFVVDPTGRYTAVPRVEPRVEETAFC
jgi:3',5'-cyclic-AMP phosphodiesterase